MRRPNAASLPEIIQIIGRLELDEQTKPLSDDQRSALAERLFDLNETPAQLQRRADSVFLRETYGTIAYKYWLEEGEVRPVTEINAELYRLSRLEETRRANFEREMDERIDYRLKALRGIANPHEAKNFEREMEMIEIQNTIAQQREENKRHIEEVRKEVKKKLATCREWLVSLNIEQRKVLLLEAVQQGLLKEYSGIELSHIQYYNDVLLPLYEKRKKQ